MSDLQERYGDAGESCVVVSLALLVMRLFPTRTSSQRFGLESLKSVSPRGGLGDLFLIPTPFVAGLGDFFFMTLFFSGSVFLLGDFLCDPSISIKGEWSWGANSSFIDGLLRLVHSYGVIFSKGSSIFPSERDSTSGPGFCNESELWLTESPKCLATLARNGIVLFSVQAASEDVDGETGTAVVLEGGQKRVNGR